MREGGSITRRRAKAKQLPEVMRALSADNIHGALCRGDAQVLFSLPFAEPVSAGGEPGLPEPSPAATGEWRVLACSCFSPTLQCVSTCIPCCAQRCLLELSAGATAGSDQCPTVQADSEPLADDLNPHPGLAASRLCLGPAVGAVTAKTNDVRGRWCKRQVT